METGGGRIESLIGVGSDDFRVECRSMESRTRFSALGARLVLDEAMDDRFHAHESGGICT